MGLQQVGCRVEYLANARGQPGYADDADAEDSNAHHRTTALILICHLEANSRDVEGRGTTTERSGYAVVQSTDVSGLEQVESKHHQQGIARVNSEKSHKTDNEADDSSTKYMDRDGRKGQTDESCSCTVE
jgi:hypothetical protein